MTEIDGIAPGQETTAVSIVMPVRDAERYVSEAIQSVLVQTLGTWELLVIDDGCEDKTIQITNSFRDERIRVLDLGGRHGIAVALNLGLQEAKGRYIARLDADDVAYPSRLEKQVQYMDANPHVGLLGSWFETIEPTPQCHRHAGSSADVYFTMLSGNPICHSTVMLRASLLKENALRYRQNFVPSEDYDLWQRMSVVSEVEIFSEVLVGYRVHEAQSSLSLNSERNIHDEVVRSNHRMALGFLFPRPKSDSQRFIWLLLNYSFWRPGSRESYKALHRLLGAKLIAVIQEKAKTLRLLVFVVRWARKFN